MGYDLKLAERLRIILGSRPGIIEKKMFGGVGFLLDGNLLCGVHKEGLILRLGKEASVAALKQDHTRPFDVTGRPMSGWLMVDPQGVAEDAKLKDWVERALTFVSTLPAK
jgi:TfoX/Sxy family transcriptional regulator of competence genes